MTTPQGTSLIAGTDYEVRRLLAYMAGIGDGELDLTWHGEVGQLCSDAAATTTLTGPCGCSALWGHEHRADDAAGFVVCVLAGCDDGYRAVVPDVAEFHACIDHTGSLRPIVAHIEADMLRIAR